MAIVLIRWKSRPVDAEHHLSAERARAGARAGGPAALLLAWALHDLEEALAFPATCGDLADRTGIEALRITPRQSWAAVGLMGILVGAACARGIRTDGDSALYRAVLAGLEAHVATHLLASAALRRYTAGVATALPVMLPGALLARRALAERGRPLRAADARRGAMVLLPAAWVCNAVARRIA